MGDLWLHHVRVSITNSHCVLEHFEDLLDYIQDAITIEKLSRCQDPFANLPSGLKVVTKVKLSS